MSRDPISLPESSLGTDAVSKKRTKRQFSQGQIRRIAQVIECGDCALLSEIPTRIRREVVREIVRLRRKRLMEFVARAIANDIRRSREPKTEAF